MTTTSPDNIRTPNPSDPYNLVTDLGVLANDTQTALTRRANLYVGTKSERAAFTSAPEGVRWQDTDGLKGLWVRQSGAWVGGDTGWVTITNPTGVSGSAKYRQIGKQVSFVAAWTLTTPLTPGSVLVLSNVLPTGVRPSANTPISAVGGGLRTVNAWVGAVGNGNMQLYNGHGTLNTFTVEISGMWFIG